VSVQNLMVLSPPRSSGGRRSLVQHYRLHGCYSVLARSSFVQEGATWIHGVCLMLLKLCSECFGIPLQSVV